jgi:hypothetical protein
VKVKKETELRENFVLITIGITMFQSSWVRKWQDVEYHLEISPFESQ